MIEFFDDLTLWHWLGLAGVVFSAHAIMPFGMAYSIGRGVLALGLAATIVSLALFAAPGITGLQQLGLVAVASMASAYGLKWWAARGFRRATHHLGQVFTLTEAIVAGKGRLQIAGESWPIRGDDLPAGAKIKVADITETVQVAELRPAGAGEAPFEPGALVQIIGTELTLEVEKT